MWYIAQQTYYKTDTNMSVISIETGTPLKERLSPSRLKTALSQLALRRSDPLPPELDLLVHKVDDMPETDLDRGLRMMVDHDLWPQDIREHPEELPPAYAEKIADVALKVVSREPELLTSQALAALGRAADDTGDHDLLERALEKATAMPPIVQIDPNTEALQYALEHNVPFRESLSIVRGDKIRRDIPMKLRPSPAATAASARGHVHATAAPTEKDDYEFLYDKKAKVKITKYIDTPVPVDANGNDIPVEQMNK